MSGDEMLEGFLEQGFFLLPCYSVNPDGRCTCGSPHDKSVSDRASRGKHPIINEWTKFASNDPAQIAEWSGRYPKINWGVYSKPSGLFVMDIDPRNGGEKSLYRLECDYSDVLPRTYRVVTGAYDIGNMRTRGEHLYFRVPEGVTFKSELGKEMRGIDLKWNGYVLLPGSRHFSGVTYELAGDSLPLSEIAELPGEMLEAFSKTKRRRANLVTVPTFSNRTTPYGAEALRQEVEAIASTDEGSRNNTLFRKVISISELIGGGELPPQAIGIVAEAAKQSGLSDDEIDQVLFREGGAFQIGLSQPRTSGNPVVSIDKGRGGALPDSWGQEFLNQITPVNWAEAFEAEWEEDWFVRGLIARGRSHAIYSEPGIGKSVITRQLCAELCAEKVVLGTHAYKEPIKVLFFDHENTIVQDVVPQLRELGFSPKELDFLVYLSFPEMRELDTAEGGKQFEALLDHHKPDLVVLDTVSRTISQDENQNQTWLDFYRYAGVQLKNRGIAYIRLDHTGKNVDRGMRGGSAKKGDLDLVWLLSESTKPGRFTLTCEKSRLPLGHKRLEIMRELDPLHHKLMIPRTEVDWKELLKPLELYKALWGFFKKEEAATGKVRGSGKLWVEHQKEFEVLGIPKTFLEKTLKDYRAGESALEPW